MGRKQVIVQLDDELVAGLDREAERAGVSRSELIRRATSALLEASREAELDRRHQEGYRRFPEDPLWTDTAARLAVETWDRW